MDIWITAHFPVTHIPTAPTTAVHILTEHSQPAILPKCLWHTGGGHFPVWFMPSISADMVKGKEIPDEYLAHVSPSG